MSIVQQMEKLLVVDRPDMALILYEVLTEQQQRIEVIERWKERTQRKLTRTESE